MGKRKKHKNTSMRVAAGVGGKCPSCSKSMQRYRHGDGWQPKPGREWYEAWDICHNRKCKTTLVMQPEFNRKPMSPAERAAADQVALHSAGNPLAGGWAMD